MNDDRSVGAPAGSPTDPDGHETADRTEQLPVDRTARLELDGTVGSGRPGSPPSPRARVTAPGWGHQTPGRATPDKPAATDETRAPETPAAEAPAAETPVEAPAAETPVEAPAADDTARVEAVPSEPTEPSEPSEPTADDDTARVEAVPGDSTGPPATDDDTVVAPTPTPAPAPAPAPDMPATIRPALVAPAPSSRPRWRRPAVLVPAAVLGVLAAAYAADLLVAGDDLPRNTVVAGVQIGGLSPAAAAETLTRELAPEVVADHVIVADDVEGVLSPATAGISLDVEGSVAAASGQPLNPWSRLVSLFSEREVAPVITGEDTALAAQIDAFAESVDRAPVDATIAVDGTTATVVPEVVGRTLDRTGAGRAVTEALSSGGDPATPIELPVDVVDVRVDAAAADAALQDVVTPALSAPVTVRGDDGSTAELGVDGIAAALVFSAGEDGVLDVSLDPAQLQTGLGDQLGEFGTPATDARFQVSGETITIVPSVDGTGIDPTVLAESLRPVLTEPAPREVDATLGAVPAAFTTEEAEALGIVEPIGSFSTNFTNSASGTNIRVVAEFVDGAVVPPGETFSLNGYTGPRGEAEGYVAAGVINNGEFTQAVGGGISQFATTMFNAVFFAGLEDVFHKPHSYYISRYPAGREATVYYDSIDLQWRNDSPTGVYVQTEWVPGTITVTLWGTARFDVESVSSDRFNVRTPVTQDKPDDGTCSPQGGSNGFDITVTRIFNDPATGEQLRTEQFRTRYAAEPVIRCVPVADPAPESTAPATPAQPTGRRPRPRN